MGAVAMRNAILFSFRCEVRREAAGNPPGRQSEATAYQAVSAAELGDEP